MEYSDSEWNRKYTIVFKSVKCFVINQNQYSFIVPQTAKDKYSIFKRKTTVKNKQYKLKKK